MNAKLALQPFEGEHFRPKSKLAMFLRGGGVTKWLGAGRNCAI